MKYLFALAILGFTHFVHAYPSPSPSGTPGYVSSVEGSSKHKGSCQGTYTNTADGKVVITAQCSEALTHNCECEVRSRYPYVTCTPGSTNQSTTTKVESNDKCEHLAPTQ